MNFNKKNLRLFGTCFYNGNLKSKLQTEDEGDTTRSFLFIGTENPADEDDRKNVGLDSENGGSYVVSFASVLLLLFFCYFV